MYELGDYGDYKGSQQGSGKQESSPIMILVCCACGLPIAAFLIGWIVLFFWYSYK